MLFFAGEVGTAECAPDTMNVAMQKNVFDLVQFELALPSC